MKAVIEWIKTGLKKRKVKVFLVFILCATLAWLINNLSRTYTSNTFFDITYVNIPKDVILANTPKDKIQVRLKAVGFQFLGFGFKSKQIKLDVSKVLRTDSANRLTEEQIKIQLEAQLPNNSTLVDFDRDPITFEFTSLASVKVPVKHRLSLSFEKNYILEGEVQSLPDSITITGPKSQIDTIKRVFTESKKVTNLSTNFSVDVPLVLVNFGDHIKFSQETINLSGAVVKFSEKVIEVPVNVINLPEGAQVRTFPEVVNVRAQGTLEKLKDLSADQFIVEADYTKASTENGNRLPLSLVRFPQNLNNATIDINEIEFILRRE